MILLDCNALCYQAYYTMKDLSKSDGTPTGVVYGFFSQVKTIVEQCSDAFLVFCWDSNESHRMALCDTYKANREEKRAENPEIFNAFFQFEELHNTILPRLGFKNNFLVKGYEADDIIASICKDYGPDPREKIIIASNDQDLYQLLTSNVSMYQPVKARFYTLKNYKDEFDITPEQWVYVKAIAGCPGDNVIGIKGVGVKTVIKYLNDKSDKKYPNINGKTAREIISRNWPLVHLPFDGTPHFELCFPNMDYQLWKEFCYEYEFTSFLKGNFFRDLFNYESPKGFVAPPAKRRKRSSHAKN